jgi:hypothetical protein
MGLKVASESARALLEEGEVVQDLLNPGTGKREPRRPGSFGPPEPPEPLAGVDVAAGVDLDEEEAVGAAGELLTTIRAGLLTDGDREEAFTVGQRRSLAGRAAVKTIRNVKKKIVALENIAIESQ